KLCAKDLHMAYTYACEMRAKLVTSGWIEILKQGQIRCLMGFVKAEKPQKQQNTTGFVSNDSEKPNSSEKPNTQPVQNSEKPNSEFGKTEFNIRKNRIAYKEEPAHGTSPCNQGEGIPISDIPPAPSVSNLENLVKAVQTVTGVKASSW